jgi:hypothetical protein
MKPLPHATVRSCDFEKSDSSPSSSASGMNATGQNLDRLIEEKNYPEFEQEFPSAKLSANDQSYFEGILADRLNQQLGLTVSKGRAQTQGGATGAEVPLRTAPRPDNLIANAASGCDCSDNP